MAVQTANITDYRKLAVSERKTSQSKKRRWSKKQVKTRELTRAKIVFFSKRRRRKKPAEGPWNVASSRPLTGGPHAGDSLAVSSGDGGGRVDGLRAPDGGVACALLAAATSSEELVGGLRSFVASTA